MMLQLSICFIKVIVFPLKKNGWHGVLAGVYAIFAWVARLAERTWAARADQLGIRHAL